MSAIHLKRLRQALASGLEAGLAGPVLGGLIQGHLPRYQALPAIDRTLANRAGGAIALQGAQP